MPVGAPAALDLHVAAEPNANGSQQDAKLNAKFNDMEHEAEPNVNGNQQDAKPNGMEPKAQPVLVWREGQEDWTRASQVSAFQGLVG